MLSIMSKKGAVHSLNRYMYLASQLVPLKQALPLLPNPIHLLPNVERPLLGYLCREKQYLQ